MAQQHYAKKRAVTGFTLVEIMITLAVVAIIMAIAVPSYQDRVREAQRADGYDALLSIKTLQERYRASNSTYGTLAQIGAASASAEGYYNVAVSNTSATGYTITATAQGSQAKDEDKGTSCKTLTITVSAANPRGARTPADCW